MKLFNRLAWKLTFVTGILVTMIVLCMSLPIYWLTRNTLEDQLADHLASNLTVISEIINHDLLGFIIRFPESRITRDSLESQVSNYLEKFSARAIYFLDPKSEILLAVGDRQKIARAVLIHKPEIERARKIGFSAAPLYKDTTGTSFKSSYKLLSLKNAPDIIIGIDADASFLKYTEILRRRIVITGAGVLLFSIILVMILAQTLTHPLRNLTEFARNIGRGRADPSFLQNRGDEIGFLGKTMETMRKEINKREKENKELIASVAHEIRNPLAGMQVNAELLLEATRNNKNLYDYSKAVTKEINNLSAIVEDFLAYARPIESTLELRSLRALIDETQRALKRDFPEHSFIIKGDIQVLIHPGKIVHAVSNLLKNACEATDPRNPVEITIAEQKSSAYISIKNSGEPIPAELQPQIFEAFFSTKGTGVGLGLSIAKSIVEQHGGTILLTHSDSDGTEFVIEIPAGQNEKK